MIHVLHQQLSEKHFSGLESSQSNGRLSGDGLLRHSGSGSRTFCRFPLGGRSGSEKRESGGASNNNSLVLVRSVSDSKINALFDQYKDSVVDSILADGIVRFCNDLSVRPDEFSVLVLAWRFEAEQMCCFTRQEFITGCKTIKVESISGIQGKLPDLCREVQQDPELFKKLYRFTFKFGLDPDQRILPAEIAICLWRLVFSQNQPHILERWLLFLDRHPHVRGIPRDTWNMFLNFVETVGDDLGSYDDAEAWPSLFDDFVEFEKDQANQNTSKTAEGICCDE
jgi:DCN1-like protein 3